MGLEFLVNEHVLISKTRYRSACGRGTGDNETRDIQIKRLFATVGYVYWVRMYSSERNALCRTKGVYL